MTRTKEFAPLGSMILLNQTGDVTIVWTEEHEESMRALIAQRIKDGYTFFVVEKKLFGLISSKQKVHDIGQIQKGTKLLLRDEDAIRLFSEGKIGVTAKEKGEIAVSHSTRDIDEILRKDTLAVKAIASG
jgi:hypothetical protein